MEVRYQSAPAEQTDGFITSYVVVTIIGDTCPGANSSSGVAILLSKPVTDDMQCDVT